MIGTLKRTVRIPANQKELFDKLAKEHGWETENFKQIMEELKTFRRPTIQPMTDEEIVAEIKAYRNGA